jgi:ribosomal protein L25 (general stress protein Ctc)
MEKLLVKNRNIQDDITAAREDGMLPAVMYGRDTDSTPIEVDMTSTRPPGATRR